MAHDAGVDRWFEASDHPLKPLMLRVREVILKADPRVTEAIKWKCPTFMYRGNIASIDPHAKRHLTLLFHRGADIPGNHPALEGGGEVARYMRFADGNELEARRADLVAVVQAWCAVKEG